MELTLPIEAEELIPHRLPMRLINRLLEVEGKNGVVDAVIEADCPLVSAEGVLEDVALVELLAQSYAAINGYCDRIENKPVKQGFLVGIKKINRLRSVKAGDRLRIDIRTLFEIDDFSVAEGDIYRGSELVMQGELKLWVNG
jgi:predicted hotdog family 3-hydroxylacyl-ACP dehydratase